MIVGEFWTALSFDKAAKESVLPHVMAGLEETRSDIRIGACIALAKLRVSSLLLHV